MSNIQKQFRNEKTIVSVTKKSINPDILENLNYCHLGIYFILNLFGQQSIKTLIDKSSIGNQFAFNRHLEDLIQSGYVEEVLS